MAQYDLLLTQNVHATLTEYSEKFVNIGKGGLLSADTNQDPVVLAVGTDGYLLSAASGQTSGLQWIDPGTLGVTVANQGNDRIVTATATTDALNAEQYLTYNTTQGLYIAQGTGILFANAAATYQIYTANGATKASIMINTGTNSTGGGGDVTIKAGDGISAGGNVYFQRDTTYGNFYFGTGSVNHVPNISSGTFDVIMVGTTDGQLGRTQSLKWVAASDTLRVDGTNGGIIDLYYNGTITGTLKSNSSTYTTLSSTDILWLQSTHATTPRIAIGDYSSGTSYISIRETNNSYADIVQIYDASTNLVFNAAEDGSIGFGQYGSGSYTGTPAYALAVDASGNIIETTLGGTGDVSWGTASSAYLVYGSSPGDIESDATLYYTLGTHRLNVNGGASDGGEVAVAYNSTATLEMRAVSATNSHLVFNTSFLLYPSVTTGASYMGIGDTSDSNTFLTVSDNTTGTVKTNIMRIRTYDLAEEFVFAEAGSLQMTAYGGGSFTGTMTYILGVDTDGNVIELTGGTVTFGTDNQIPVTNSTGDGFDYTDRFYMDVGNNRLVAPTYLWLEDASGNRLNIWGGAAPEIQPNTGSTAWGIFGGDFNSASGGSAGALTLNGGGKAGVGAGNGGAVYVRGGASSNGNGGAVYIYGGTGTANAGITYLGTGSGVTITEDTNPSYVVSIDISTGELTYTALADLGAYWERDIAGDPFVYPTTEGDHIRTRSSGDSTDYLNLSYATISMMNNSSTEIMQFYPYIGSTAAGDAYKLSTFYSITGSTTYLFQVYNSGSTRFRIDKDGNVNIPSGATYQINGTAIGGGDVTASTYTNDDVAVWTATAKQLGDTSGHLTFNGQTLTIADPTSAAESLVVGRYSGYANITSTGTGSYGDHLILDSSGAGQFLALNYYNDDRVVMCYGGGYAVLGDATTKYFTTSANALSIVSTGTGERSGLELVGNSTSSAVGSITFHNTQAAAADKRIAQIDAGYLTDVDAAYINFYAANTAGTLTSRLYIDGVNGRVGVNDASPSYSLDVTGTFRVTSTVYFDSTVYSSGAFIQDANYIRCNDNIELEMGSGNDFSIYFSGSHLYFDNTSTAYDIYFRYSTTTRFHFDMGTGDGTAADWIATSDVRVKDNIRPFEVDMDTFCELGHKSIRHNWRRGFGPMREEIGFLAQDVERYYPELVRISGEKPYMRGLSYAKMVTLAMNATAQTWEGLQVVKSEVDQLKDRVNELENELNTLKNG